MRRRTVQKSDVNKLARNWMESILTKKDWNGTELAKRAGLSPSTLLRVLNGYATHPISLGTMWKVANASGEPIPPAIIGLVEHKAPEPAVVIREPNAGLQLQRYVPLEHLTSLPSALRSKTNHVLAPQQLNDDSTLFGFYMPDASGEPFIKAGSLLFGSKLRDPLMDDLALIVTRSNKTFVGVVKAIYDDGVSLSRCAGSGVHGPIEFSNIEQLAVIRAIVVQ